jgi:hypothetical protein
MRKRQRRPLARCCVLAGEHPGKNGSSGRIADNLEDLDRQQLADPWKRGHGCHHRLDHCRTHRYQFGFRLLGNIGGAVAELGYEPRDLRIHHARSLPHSQTADQ